jgi:hypothetical protein
VCRVTQELPHLVAQELVEHDRLRMADPFFAPIDNVPHLQIGDGGKFVLRLRSATVTLAAVEKAACRDDACGQDDKNQEQNR